MSFSEPVKKITASDEEIRGALADAHLPPLLPAIAHATGDLSLLRPELRADPLLASLPNSGLSGEQAATIRQLAFDALRRFRDGGSVAVPPADDIRLLELMTFTAGGAQMTDYLGLLIEELSPTGEDLRAPRWSKADVAPDRPFTVVVIGAGMSGLLAAHRLTQVGVDVRILEKNDSLGGTWSANTYPGCRVDNPNHVYSYSFAQRDDWPYHHSPQPVLLEYFRDCAKAWDVERLVETGVEVDSATWDDERGVWRLAVRRGGAKETIEANAIVSAVGQLNRPKLPDVPGIGSFAGPSFHSATWDHDADLAGKRVAVVGNAASATQFIPFVAEQAAQLTVFQRTPNWFFASPDYQQPVAPGLRWLFQHVPYYSQWTRFWMFWRLADALLPTVSAEDGWSSPNGTISAANDFLRSVAEAYIVEQFADRPDLLAKVVPDYPIGAKRILVDDGTWARTLKRDDVELCTAPIAEVTPTGIRTADGTDHDVDVIIYGTGFQASDFLAPMTITGRDGVDLHEQWAGDARAYLGVTIPGFPNLFCLYGPNTNIVVQGSIIYFSELGTRYLTGLVELILRGGHRSAEIRRDVHDRYNERVDATNRQRSWGMSSVNSWYRNDHGRVTQNWPHTLLEYWQRTLEPDPAEYVIT